MGCKSSYFPETLSRTRLVEGGVMQLPRTTSHFTFGGSQLSPLSLSLELTRVRLYNIVIQNSDNAKSAKLTENDRNRGAQGF